MNTSNSTIYTANDLNALASSIQELFLKETKRKLGFSKAKELASQVAGLRNSNVVTQEDSLVTSPTEESSTPAFNADFDKKGIPVCRISFSLVTGTLELVPGTAGVTEVSRNKKGIKVDEYDGDTDMDWDNQKPVLSESGRKMFETENGKEVNEDEVIIIDYDDFDDIEEMIRPGVIKYFSKYMKSNGIDDPDIAQEELKTKLTDAEKEKLL